MRRTALSNLAPVVAALLLGIAALSQKAPESARPIPGAHPLALAQDLRIDVQSNPVTYHGSTFSLVRLNKARFELAGDDHLTARVSGALLTFDEVDYEVHAAVMDASGRLLGTAHAPCPVQRIWLGEQMTTQRDVALDFGISRAYAAARHFIIAVTDRKVLTPDQWQK